VTLRGWSSRCPRLVPGGQGFTCGYRDCRQRDTGSTRCAGSRISPPRGWDGWSTRQRPATSELGSNRTIWLQNPSTGQISRVARSPSTSGGLSSSTLMGRSEEHTSELQSRENLVCRLLLEKKK